MAQKCVLWHCGAFYYAPSSYFFFFMKNASWMCVGSIIRSVVLAADIIHWIACRLLLFSCFFPVLSTVSLSWFAAESESVKAYGSRMLCVCDKMPAGMEWERDRDERAACHLSAAAAAALSWIVISIRERERETLVILLYYLLASREP